MTDHTDRPDDEQRPDGAQPDPDGTGSTAYDPSAGVPSGPGTPGPYGSGSDAPAQYPPPAPYPPAGGGDPYAQPTGQPYGQAAPGYGGTPGYGSGAEYTSTPQPYAYGPPPLTPEAEKARSSAILWTILNGVSIFACANLLAIGGVICAAVAIGKARDDVQGSQNLTKWSWILFAAGFALWVLLLIGLFALGILGAFGTASMNGEF